MLNCVNVLIEKVNTFVFKMLRGSVSSTGQPCYVILICQVNSKSNEKCSNANSFALKEGPQKSASCHVLVNSLAQSVGEICRIWPLEPNKS